MTYHNPTSTIIVSTNGGDNAAGTLADPASMTRALTLAASGGAMPLILVRGGVYTLSAPYAFTDSHSSDASGRFIKIMSYPGETVEWSGGTPITGGWTGPDANGVYSKSFSGVTRQLWVNDLRATRAKKVYSPYCPSMNYSPGWIETATGFDAYTVASAGTCTISNATPCVATLSAHGRTTGDVVHLTTTGTLPIGLTAYSQASGSRIVYYVGVIDTNTFNLYLTKADALAGTNKVATTSAGSGTHTLTKYTPDTTISALSRPTDVEIVCSKLNLWKMWRLRVSAVDGNSITIRERDWTDAHAQGAGYSVDCTSIIHIENAQEWVKDLAGSWYHNRNTNTLYYKPRAGETMGTVKVVAGNLEQVATFTGQPDSKIKMKVVGINIEENTWLLPDTIGYSTCQGGIHGNINGTVGVDLLQRTGIVELENASIEFCGCTVRRTGNDGIRWKEGCQDSRWYDGGQIDIAGNAFTNGVIQSMQMYVSPADNLKNKRLIIKNNFLTDIGVDYWDGCGVFESVADSTEFCNNEPTRIAYNAFESGWYWGNSDISADSANLNFHHNKVIYSNEKTGDGGAFYTLGRHPNGECHDNYFERRQWGYKQPIYLDNGTQGMHVYNNVYMTNGDGGTQWLYLQYGSPIASGNIVENNYYEIGTAGGGVGNNTVQNNTAGAFGAAALAIKAAAGRY